MSIHGPSSALRKGLPLAILLLSLCGCPAQVRDRGPEPPPAFRPIAGLQELVTDPAPWLKMPAYSEQAPPFYGGATPREIALGLAPATGDGSVFLPPSLKSLGEAQIAAIRAALVRAKRIGTNERIEFEGWIAIDDAGRRTWAFARWRPAADAAPDPCPGCRWRWIDPASAATLPETTVPPLLPQVLRTADPKERALIFDDFLVLEGLYDKPALGNCLWTEEGEGAVLPPETQAWLPPERRSTLRAKGAPAPLCRVLNQPMRIHGRPATWRIGSDGKAIHWPAAIRWQEEPSSASLTLPAGPAIGRWPETFRDDYRKDVLTLSGEEQAQFPVTGRLERFTRKNSAEPDNQLLLLIEYLEERYRSLGLKTFRQEFVWRGIPQANLVAIIPGTEPASTNRPVLLADHIDTAFCDDVYAAVGQRLSAPGADDNGSATGVLLRAAEILKEAKPRYDLWLTHFTGEEYPADCMGARILVGDLLKRRQDIRGLVLMDMIGWREGGDPLFQVNEGAGQAAAELSATALAAAATIAAAPPLALQPILRKRHDERSYLYNTDGLPFSDAGYPVVLFNEHLNRLENLNRVGYHHTLDIGRLIDWDYAAAIAKTAIETAARLAGAKLP